jgi:NAD(P)-dependent dehydrogenase (short-subunit alcohol dehydrogenase family)
VDGTIEVNLRGYFYASMLAGRAMRERGRGVIVNVSSINAGVRGRRASIR